MTTTKLIQGLKGVFSVNRKSLVIYRSVICNNLRLEIVNALIIKSQQRLKHRSQLVIRLKTIKNIIEFFLLLIFYIFFSLSS